MTFPDLASKTPIVQVSTRPTRIAYIVNRDVGGDALLQICRYNASVWGGKFNFFVPTDGDTIDPLWFQWLVEFDPDVIICVGNVAKELLIRIDSRTQPLSYFEWDISKPLLVSQATQIPVVPIRAVFNHLMSRASKEIDHPSTISRLDETLTTDISLMFIVGEWQEGLKSAEAVKDYITFDQISGDLSSLGDRLNLLTTLYSMMTPLNLTDFELNRTYFNPRFDYGFPLIISNGAVDDIFLQHSCRDITERFQISVAPIIHIDALSQSADQVNELVVWLSQHLKGNVVSLVSTTCSFEQLKPIGEMLAEEFNKVDPNRQCQVRVREPIISFPYVEHSTQSQLTRFEEDRLTVKVNRPSFLTYDMLRSLVWMTDLDVAPGPFNRSGYIPTRYRLLNEHLAYPSGRPQLGSARPSIYQRMSRERLSRQTNIRDEFLAYSFAKGSKLIQGLLENYGLNVNRVRSDGQRNRARVRLLGGINELRNITRDIPIKIFDAYRGSDRGAEKYSSFKELMSQIKLGKRGQELQETLSDLSQKGIIVRGYEQTCPTCGLKTWYRLKDVGETTLCYGCGEYFPTDIKLNFSFKLNHLFSGNEDQGWLCVLLTINLLYRSVKKSLLYDSEIKFYDSDDSEYEFDIIAMCDGRLVVTECKNSIKVHELEELKKQLERQIRMAERIGAELFIFALRGAIPTSLDSFFAKMQSNYAKISILSIDEQQLLEGAISNPDDSQHQTFIDDLIDHPPAHPIPR